MNWDAFGAIAEFGGAIAVVVSLVYLAIQVRQNTRAIQGQIAHAVRERQQEDWQVIGREQVSSDLAADIDALLENAELTDWKGALAALKDVGIDRDPSDL